MAITRIKFLDRKKIKQADVSIKLSVVGGTKNFTIKSDLSEYGFPVDARICVDAKQLMETLRFDLGTVGRPRPDAPIDISRLRGERVTFNLYVLNPDNSQKLGSSETVRPENDLELEGGSIPLLPVDVADDLNGLAWRVDYVGDDLDDHRDAPVLVFDRNAADGSPSIFLQDPAVRVLVLPSAMREILVRILLIDEHEFSPDSTTWQDCWLRFAQRITQEELPSYNEGRDSKGEDREEFIKKSTSALARHADFLQIFINARKK
jgi:hypothetical protein